MRRPVLRDADDGFVLVWFAAVIAVLVAIAALVVDILHGYSVVQRVQNAADAGALAGVQHLPDNRADAEVTARAVVKQNAPVGDADVSFGAVSLQSQLDVSVTEKVPTFFGRFLGVDELTVTRRAVAEFDPPIAMGSPSSSFGNVPGGGPNRGYWASVAGRDSVKGGGNAAMSHYCETGAAPTPNWPSAASIADNCAGDVNPDYEGAQWFVIDKRNAGALRVDLFDPVWVHTVTAFDTCDHAALRAVWMVVDAGAPGSRYDPANRRYCTGDQIFRFRGSDAYTSTDATTWTFGPIALDNNSATSRPTARQAAREERVQDEGRALRTTFELFPPDDTPLNPFDNADGPAACAQTYAGHANAWRAYTAGDGMFGFFHDWTPLPCSTTPTRPGKYTLRVTTGPSNAVGANQFSIAAYTAAGSRNGGDPAVSLYSVDRMGISTNEESATGEFHLARIPPSSVRRTLRVTLFDVGDLVCQPSPCTAYSVSARVFAEHARAGATGAPVAEFPFGNCTYSPPPGFSGHGTPLLAPWKANAPAWGPPPLSPTASQCTITGITNSAWNGQYVTLDVPIPDESGYWCDASDPTACWLKIRFAGSPTNVRITDVSTWVASLNGNPTRLIE